jgi:hypothetical protein
VGKTMSRLMSLFGIVLAVAGLALIFLSVADPGMMQVYGVTPEAGAILLIGGVLSLGLGGVISAIESAGLGVAEPVMKASKAVIVSLRWPIQFPPLNKPSLISRRLLAAWTM